MDILISAGIAVLIVLIMFFFGLYTRRNAGWVALSLLWGTLSYGVFFFLEPELIIMGLDHQEINILTGPLIQFLLIGLGIFVVVTRERFDNLIDGAVYGVASGLGYAASENFLKLSTSNGQSIESSVLQALSLSLVYATAAGGLGVAISQFYFRHRANRITLLLSGLGASVAYTALYKLLVELGIGGNLLSAVFGIGGLALVGLYLIGLLRKILIQVGVEKRRADSLLEIVIPIGVELSAEENFGKLLEKMLLEAKAFCKADAGILYLLKDDLLEFSVVRNDTLDISIGGTSGNQITLPPINMNKENGQPNYSNLAACAAITGETINVEDSFDDERFDFSGTREFDERTGYISTSFLTIPLKNKEGKVLGVLQLINALDSRKKTLISFDNNLQQLMESFSSLATAALEGYIQEQSLRKEIQELRIEIDAVKRDKQVESITNSDYFKELQKKAKNIRNDKEKG